MPVFNTFAPSVLGMMAQSQGLGTISQNIANVNTGGFKRTETRFQTVLSEAIDQHSDLGGVRPKEINLIDKQGAILGTTRDLDLAISGHGFFIVSTALTGGETLYTRDGTFEIKNEGTGAATQGYLVDKNGHYLQGWAPDATTGVFPTTGTPQALRVDATNFANTFEATTTAEIGLNLPAETPLTANHATAVTTANSGPPPAGFHAFTFSVVDATGAKKTVRLNFTRSALNTWQMSTTSGSPSTTTAATTITFNNKGGLNTITGSAVTNNRTLYNDPNDGFNFSLDLTDLTQFDTGFVTLSQNINGFEKSNLTSLSWDQNGYLIGNFDNDNDRRLYRVPLATFANPNGLEMKSGMVFAQSPVSGAPTITAVDVSDQASFVPGAIESSNVNLEDEFARMIMTQAVYNANALAFRTNDEMTVVARDLTRA